MSLVSQWMVKEVRTVSPDQTVIDACLIMQQYKIGCVVVTEDKKVVGMFTERDMVTRVGAAGLDMNKTLIKEVMTSQVITATTTLIGLSDGKITCRNACHSLHPSIDAASRSEISTDFRPARYITMM